MNLKTSVIMGTALLLLSACHSSLNAVDMKNAPSSAVDRPTPLFSKAPDRAYIQSLNKGMSFQSGRDTYQLLPELFSLSGNRTSDPSSKTEAKHETDKVPDAELVYQKGRFLIYRSSTVRRSTLSLSTEQTPITYPVVLNQRTQKLGLIPGTLKIKLDNPEDAERLLQNFPLTLIRKFPQLNLAFYQVNVGEDLMEIANNLRALPGITTVTIEIIENLRTPQ